VVTDDNTEKLNHKLHGSEVVNPPTTNPAKDKVVIDNTVESTAEESSFKIELSGSESTKSSIPVDMTSSEEYRDPSLQGGGAKKQ